MSFRPLKWGLLLFAPTLLAKTPVILFQGVPEKWQPTLQAGLSLTEERCDTPHWRIRYLFEKADGELHHQLRAFGHYQPKIEKILRFDDGCWKAIFKIELGPRIKIARAEIKLFGQAAHDPSFQEFLTRNALRVGQPLHHGRYERFKRNLLALAEARGYFKARFLRHELRVDPERQRAEIVLHFESGPRFKIGSLHFPLLKAFDPAFLRRFLPFREGDFYDREKIEQLQRDLIRSGYFRDVEVIPLKEGALDHEVPVEVRLAPQKRHLFTFGVGFDTNTGPRGLLRYENRYLNRRGHRVELTGRYSPVKREVQGEYLIPWWRPAKEWFSLGSRFLQEETDTFETRSVLFGSRFFHHHFGWQETFGLDFRYETSKLQGRAKRLLLLLPTIGWQRTEKDHPTLPQKGLRFDFELTAGLGLASQVPTFFKGHLLLKGIHSLPWSARLLGRIEAGGVFGQNFKELPASQRFFTGGFDSIRGFGYKRLGGSGGRYLLVGSLEYEQKMARKFGFVLFTDGGNAYGHLDDPTFVGAGIGFRWFSPIGPIRFDLATPVRGKSPKIRLHISMGPDL